MYLYSELASEGERRLSHRALVGAPTEVPAKARCQNEGLPSAGAAEALRHSGLQRDSAPGRLPQPGLSSRELQDVLDVARRRFRMASRRARRWRASTALTARTAYSWAV